jgi:hypothetical protein
MTRFAVIVFSLTLLLIITCFVCALCDAAQAVTPEQWCNKWEKRLFNVWDRWSDADQCFYAKPLTYYLEYDTPPDGADDATYLHYGRTYRHYYYKWQHEFLHLKHKMQHPKRPYHLGSWKPLIRWTWRNHSEAVVRKVDTIIGRESTWNPMEITGPYVGLMQCYHGSTDPMTNLKTAHRWHHDDLRQGGDGWRPWAQTAY